MWIPKWERDMKKGVDSPIPTQVVSNEEFIPRPQNAEQAEVDDTRVQSEAVTIRAMAEAQAEASAKRAAARKEELISEAEGESALIKAENGRRDELVK